VLFVIFKHSKFFISVTQLFSLWNSTLNSCKIEQSSHSGEWQSNKRQFLPIDPICKTSTWGFPDGRV